MAYVTYNKYRNRMNRRFTRRARTARTKRAPRRRARRYRRKTMSKRSLLNVTSTKKRNTLLNWSNTTATGAFVTPGIRPYVVPATLSTMSIWSPTAMDMTRGDGVLGTKEEMSTRTASTCFMKGLSERLRIETSSGLAWFHRRICIISHQRELAVNASPATYVDTTSGLQRLWRSLSADPSPEAANQLTFLKTYLFRGTENQDWNDLITAPIDTNGVKVVFDKTWTLKSGNSNGIVAERKLWHGMNKNLYYDEDEDGSSMRNSYWCAPTMRGMANYFVIDIIMPGTGGTASDLMKITSTSTMYWHEK